MQKVCIAGAAPFPRSAGSPLNREKRVPHRGQAFNLRRHKNDRERYMRLSAIFSSIGEERRNSRRVPLWNGTSGVQPPLGRQPPAAAEGSINDF